MAISEQTAPEGEDLEHFRRWYEACTGRAVPVESTPAEIKAVVDKTIHRDSAFYRKMKIEADRDFALRVQFAGRAGKTLMRFDLDLLWHLFRERREAKGFAEMQRMVFSWLDADWPVLVYVESLSEADAEGEQFDQTILWGKRDRTRLVALLQCEGTWEYADGSKRKVRDSFPQTSMSWPPSERTEFSIQPDGTCFAQQRLHVLTD